MKARAWLALLAAGAAGAIGAGLLLQRWDWATMTAGALAGAALRGLYWWYSKMRPVLGRATATIAICTAGGLVFMGIASMSPVCPVLGATTRCTLPQLSVVTTSGLIGPAAYLLLTMLIASALRLTRAGGRGVARAGRWATAPERRYRHSEPAGAVTGGKLTGSDAIGGTRRPRTERRQGRSTRGRR